MCGPYIPAPGDPVGTYLLYGLNIAANIVSVLSIGAPLLYLRIKKYKLTALKVLGALALGMTLFLVLTFIKLVIFATLCGNVPVTSTV